MAPGTELSTQRIRRVIPPAGDRGLYLCELDLPAPELAARWRLLSAEERARGEAFTVPGAGDRFAAARGALRLVLAQWLERPPAEIPLARTELGKPFVPGSDAAFSLSHSGTRAAVACSRRGRVGVDIEAPDPGHRWRAVLRRVSGDAEWTELERAGPVTYEEFLRRWTAKEALAKADGRGLTLDLRTVTLQRSPEGTLRVAGFPGDPAAARRWTFQELGLADGAAVCVAWEAGG